MRYIKKDGIYRIILMSGAQNNILGVVFADKNNSDNNIEVIEWPAPKIINKKKYIRPKKKF